MIFMLGCAAGGKVLVSLDDTSVWQDEGVAYSAYAIPNPVNFGATSLAGRLRRISQSVTLGGDATITITPWGDGSEHAEQAFAKPMMASDGASQILLAEPALDAQRFSYRMGATAFTASVEFGEADLEMIEKRTA